MKLHHRARETCLWMLGAAALSGVTGCVGNSPTDQYWQHASTETTSGTMGDIFGDWDMGTPKPAYGFHTWGVDE